MEDIGHAAHDACRVEQPYPALDPLLGEQFQQIDVPNQIFNKENKFIKVIIYPKIVNRFSIFELVICDKKPNIDIEIKENVDYNKEIMTKFSIQKYTDMFYQIKDVVNFEENSFYIINIK